MTRTRRSGGVLRPLLALLLALPLLGGCLGLGQDQTRLTIQFTDATGLFQGNDVGIRGVGVGTVESITPAGAYVEVEVVVDGDVKLPKDVGAVIVSRSVATDRYVELTPAYTSGPEIQDGAVIAADRTRTPVEFEQLLGSLEDVSSALGGPDGGVGGAEGPLHDLLAASAANLQGNGGTIAAGLSDLATVLASLSGSMPAVEQNLTNLDTLTQTLAANDTLVRNFVTQVTDATVMLDGQKLQIQATFDAVTAMLQGLTEFSAAHREQIADQIDDFVALSDELVAHEQDITQLLRNGPLVTQNLPGAIDSRGRLRFLTRPADLVPGRSTIEEACHSVEVLCDDLALDQASIFDLLDLLRGERR
ncbi:MCE family protein [Aeromicrobium sp.]|uniref:MCE family protein n=1 Tax=Aeromicrobium sp. TaxID=1871063 RepID=UPI0025B95592|nr:MCE family protein [Aeromicrobium sp.]MCK5892423.1 MCE family protein [Aeromicrobium sp.]